MTIWRGCGEEEGANTVVALLRQEIGRWFSCTGTGTWHLPSVMRYKILGKSKKAGASQRLWLVTGSMMARHRLQGFKGDGLEPHHARYWVPDSIENCPHEP